MHTVQSQLSFLAIAAISSAFGVAACGSSATTATAPSSLTRCSVTLNGGGTVPAQGGSGTIGVSAARECSWAASTEGAWLTIRSGGSGQGDGAVEFAAAPNPDPAVRRGAVILNAQRFDVTQAAGECSFSLGQGAASVSGQGGPGQVDLRASSLLCAWSAEADVSWIAVRTAQGTGSALVPFEVMPLAGSAGRTGTIRIGGLQFSVAQSEGCAFTITPGSHAVGTGGGSGSISITTGPGCPWSAASTVDWLTFSPASGAGSGTTSFSIAPSGGTSRAATASVAGQAFTVTQSGSAEPGACSYIVQPLTHSVPASGGTVSVSVATPDACTWTASSAVPWAAVSGRSSFVGSDSVTFAISPAAGARTGTLTVAGQTVAIAQAAGCSYALSSTNVNVPPGGGSSSVSVTAGGGCAWTAASQADWITITGGTSGTGNGSVTFQTAPLAGGGSRSGTLTIAGQTVTVTQSAPSCTFSIAPEAQSVGAAGGTVAVEVATAEGCSWSAASDVPWMSVAPAGGAGSGVVQVNVQANGGAARSGTATIAGRTFTVNQAAATACTYQVQPTSVDRNWRAWQIELTVSTASGCAWSASTSVDWLTVSPATGQGSGSVVLQMLENAGPERRTTVLVAGQAVEVIQRGRN
jgi:hypothetical protein